MIEPTCPTCHQELRDASMRAVLDPIQRDLDRIIAGLPWWARLIYRARLWTAQIGSRAWPHTTHGNGYS